MTFNIAVNLITLSCKHFSPKGFPTKVFAGQRSLSNTAFKRLFWKTGLYPPTRMSNTGCEDLDRHARGKGTHRASLCWPLPGRWVSPRRLPDGLRDHDPCAGLCWERLLSYFLTQIFPDLQMRVSEPRPFLELSHWLGCPQGYKRTVHAVSCIYTSHSLLLLPASPFPLKVSFLFFLIFFFFAKQPCERDEMILKSIIWWEFWQ